MIGATRVAVGKVKIKTTIFEVLHGHLHHLQGMRTLNANRQLARFVTFEAVICEDLLYSCKLLRPHVIGEVI